MMKYIAHTEIIIENNKEYTIRKIMHNETKIDIQGDEELSSFMFPEETGSQISRWSFEDIETILDPEEAYNILNKNAKVFKKLMNIEINKQNKELGEIIINRYQDW